MPRDALPPVAAVVSFVDCINRADVDGLRALMSDDHRLVVLDEPPLVGRDANIDAWRGYFSSFPRYVIHPRHIAADGSRVAVLGATTGSHLGLPDEEELQLGVIWVADVAGGVLSSWRVVEDTPDARRRYRVLAGSSTST
jgi:ketosteroid isomerase-like protein